MEQIQSVRAQGKRHVKKVLGRLLLRLMFFLVSIAAILQLQGRHSQQQQLEESDEDDSETTDDSSLDSDDVADYLANVEPHSTDSNSGQEQVCCA